MQIAGLSTVLSLLLVSQCTLSEATSRCRCVPHNEECWPLPEDWQSLNKTVSGRLTKPVTPVASCLPEDFNSQDCQESLKRLSEDPFYLETLPGATQSTG